METGTRRRLPARSLLALVAAVVLAGIGAPARAQEATPPAGPRDVILATTTSTQDSGLLDVLVPLFAEQTGYHAQADRGRLRRRAEAGRGGRGRRAAGAQPQAEAEFMAAGYGGDRRMVMYNDFVIVGPATTRRASRG